MGLTHSRRQRDQDMVPLYWRTDTEPEWSREGAIRRRMVHRWRVPRVRLGRHDHTNMERRHRASIVIHCTIS